MCKPAKGQASVCSTMYQTVVPLFSSSVGEIGSVNLIITQTSFLKIYIMSGDDRDGCFGRILV